MQPFTFNTTPSIRFGTGLLNKVNDIAAPLLGKCIVIVTDQGMMATDIPNIAKQSLTKAGAEVHIFDGVTADPSEAVILQAQSMMIEVCATGVLGLGGGSSLDAAKLAAALAVSKARLEDCYGIELLPPGRLPLAVVPTTAGTGSEVTPISIITTGTNKKSAVVSPYLLPDLAILDPTLTTGLPAHVTAATGIDAMVHAIESYCSANPNNNPVSRVMAKEALRLLGKSLETAVLSPNDLSARSDMLLGSFLAGQAFANSPVAAVHALAYPIGSRFKVPHGLSNALVLPHVLRFNAETVPQVYAEIAPILFPDLVGNNIQVSLNFCNELQRLIQRCGLPLSLRDVGIRWDDLPVMASDAMNQTRLLVNNPRKMTQSNILKIYEDSW